MLQARVSHRVSRSAMTTTCQNVKRNDRLCALKYFCAAFTFFSFLVFANVFVLLFVCFLVFS